MKTQKLFGMLLLFFIAFSFTSCSDDDNDLSQLTGDWVVKEPVLKDEYIATYTFYPNGICSVYIGSPWSNGVPIKYKYKIGNDGKSITLVSDEYDSTERYEIVQLTSTSMKWKNLTPKDEHDLYWRLEKIEDAE